MQIGLRVDISTSQPNKFTASEIKPHSQIQRPRIASAGRFAVKPVHGCQKVAGAQHTIEVLVLHVVQQVIGADEEGYRRTHRRFHSVRASAASRASRTSGTSSRT